MKKFISILLVFAILLTVNSISFADGLSYGTTALGLGIYCDYLVRSDYNNAVIIAVIDTGIADIDFLQDKLVDGYDFIDNDTDATNDISSDSHGTTIASIIADATDKLPIYIMPVRILEEKDVQIENLILGIKYAVDNGADVVNLSIGGQVSNCDEIDAAIDYAYENNVSVIAAAGNERIEISDYCPAHNESAITVSAVDYENKFAKKFSNFGENIDCCAPGVNLIGYNSEGMPQTVNGTSFSAALISAGVAMLKLEHPGYSVGDIQDELKSICLDLGEVGFDYYYGYGIPQFNKKLPPSITIDNVEQYSDKKIDYYSTITFTAKTTNASENAKIYWFVNDNVVGEGETYTLSEVTENFTVQVKLVVEDKIVSESSVGQVYVKKSVADIVWAFARCLFDKILTFINSFTLIF